ncbi:Dihydropyridine-sensitive L-type skeletal muscle calcium channel subunit alpha-1 [Durusdinium trenchii]|uniref:Dihydropyridine-sensitive L-type skeletal muscle calcium channel subunit alpha-1 n=1 Tax=Durusdinium trenchii TaxID=1381693 RepID=A0ABP0LS39_9DINO
MGTSLPTPVRPVRMQKSTSEDLTCVPTDGFIGTDRLQAFVQSQRLQAASEQTQSAQLNMTIQVQLQEPREIVVPPATIQMPGRLNVFEDSVTDPSIEIHDLKTLAPSGVFLASALTENDGSSRTCLRALEPYTWINESLSTQPCDLWLLINSNGTSMEQLSCEDEGCTLRPAHMADQCLTFITGPVAETAGRPSGGWSLAPCQNTSASSYQSQAFDYTSLAGSNGRFCVQTLNGLEGCFDTLVMEVISQLYYGRPTYTPLVVGVPPLNCSGFVDMMALPEENLTLNENVTDFQLARDRCMGSLSCEYIFDPVGIIDPAPDCIKELVVNYTCPNHEMFQSSTLVYPGQAASMRIQCPVTFLPSVEPLAVHGSLGSGSFLLHSSIDMRRLRQLTSCPSSWRPEINATLPMESFETLVDGGRSSEFCIIGAPVALSEFAQHLRYLPASHWSGSEPVRLMLTAADDPSVVHGTAESWAVVERKNDHPNITAHQLEFQVRIGESLLLSGINISDADMGDGTKWMTLLVATSIGRLYLDPSFLLAPLGTLEPLQGRLDGDFALRVRGSGHDLQAFVDNLRFASEAPAKPSLATRPLNASETEAIISYVLSDTITPQAGALRRHQVAGKVVDPETDEPVQGVEVVLIAQDTWHDYLGYNLATGCSRELLGWTVADCKSYAEQQGHPGFTYGLSSTGGAQACCFKSEDVDLILMNLVADLNVNVYIFQPGGYFVRTTTSALGMYTALMPTGPADIYFTKALRNTRNLSIVVNDNIQVGGAADIYLPALNVVTIWRFEVDWISTAPVDLDAHAFDAWNCHVYFANRLCQHDGSHGLTVTLTRSSRDLLIGKEIITVHQWPCDSTQATIGGYRDIWSCLAYFWVQIFSLHTFADVQGKVSIFRQSILVQEVQLPADNAANDFWVGFVLDWDTSAVYLSANETGTSQLAETFLGGRYELPPVRQVRRLEESESVRILSGTCGDGYRESSEACDDGNLDAGDGCSESPDRQDIIASMRLLWILEILQT